MHIESPTPRDRLSPKHVTSLPRKKFRTTFGSSINDSEEDEQTCLDDIGNGGGEELDAIAM